MNDRLKIKITTNASLDFIKELVRNKIYLYFVDRNEKELIIVINKEDLEKIKKLTKKKIEIISYYGKSKLKIRLKRYGPLLLFFLISVLTNIFLSHIILKVEVDTPNTSLQEEVKKSLKDLGISPFHFKVSFEKKEEIKKELLEIKKEKIEWLEIEEKGTKYLVKVEEKKKNTIDEECSPRNVVARKNAMITKIESSSGQIMKKKYDYVSKGEVIISGLIYNKEDVVGKKCAEGKVLGETWYKVTVEVPINIYKESLTKEKSFIFYIKYKNKKIILGKKYKNYKIQEYNIIDSKIFPMKIGFGRIQKLLKEEIKYTKNNVEKKALQEGELKLEEQLKLKPNIIKKKVLKKSIKDSKIIVEVFYALEENITSYQEISQSDLEKMKEKEE